jgi:hypothetical protein
MMQNPAQFGNTTSSFITRRFPADKVTRTVGESAMNSLGALFRGIDKFTSRAIVGGKFYELLDKGASPEDAMKLADTYAAKLISDRSVGQLPVLFSATTLKPLTQFQIEVNNQLSFLFNYIPLMAEGNKLKVAIQITQVALESYLYNNLYEQLTGRRPALDPLHYSMALLGLTDETEDASTGQRVLQAGKEALGGVPFVGGFLEGGRLPVSAGLPNVSAMLKGQANIGQELQKPAYYFLPPVGGGQLKKSIEGLTAFGQEESRTQAGKKRFEIEQTPGNLLKSLLFGQYSTEGGQEYVDQLERKSLGTTKSKKKYKRKQR